MLTSLWQKTELLLNYSHLFLVALRYGQVCVCTSVHSKVVEYGLVKDCYILFNCLRAHVFLYLSPSDDTHTHTHTHTHAHTHHAGFVSDVCTNHSVTPTSFSNLSEANELSHLLQLSTRHLLIL